jgi:competence protein ComEC
VAQADSSPRAYTHAYQPLVVVLAAVCAGIALDRWLAIWLSAWLLTAMAAWLVWWRLWRRNQLQWSALVLLVGAAAAAGAWHHCRWSLFADNEASILAPQALGPVAVELRALDGSRRIPAPPADPLRTIAQRERTRIEVEVLAVRDRDVWRTASGRATLLIDGNVLDVNAGDTLRAFAQWSRASAPANPGEFDFSSLARSRRELVTLFCEFPECLTSDGAGWNWPRLLHPARLVDWLRTHGEVLLWQTLGPDTSGLAAAMFLGARNELDPELAQAFVETGTIHLLVVSGLNVGILSMFLLLALQVLLVPRGWALTIVMTACLLYAATTDGEPPVVRATVMVLVGCLAMLLSRRPLHYNTLAAAGIVVLAINPSELFSAGTQLSFLAVGVLVFASETRLGKRELDPLERLIARTRPLPERVLRQWSLTFWRATIATTLIWLVVAPLVMARFHLVSPVAVLLGPLLAIPVTIAMGCGFGIFLTGWLLPPLGASLGWLCEKMLLVMQLSVESARNVPFSHQWVAGPGDWWLAGFYGLLLVSVLVPGWRPSRRWLIGLIAGWIAIGFGVSLLPASDRAELRCTFLSVGHGAAVVVELPGGQTLLYDCGRLGSPTSASRIVSSFLWSRGITHLDAVVVSHADADHYNALPAILEQHSVGIIYVSPVMFDDPSSRALAAVRGAIDARSVPLEEVWAGDRLRAAGDVKIEVMHPPRLGVIGSDNANSIVLAVEYQGRRILLTGDVEPPGLNDLYAELPYDCDVTMAPHHGSMASDPPGFIAWATPEWTVISGGQSDRVPAVRAAFAAEGSEVLHTAEVGAVTARIVAGQVSVQGYRGAD